MSITIAELSRRLGLSQSTVSKALNDRSDVAEATRERVRQAAADFDYQPSSAARSLRNQQTNKLGLIVNYPIDQVDDFLSELIPGVAIAAEQAEYNLTLYTSVAGQPEKIAKLCRAREVDGMILLWPPQLDKTMSLIEQEGMPFIVMPRRVPHLNVSFVAADHVQGARKLTQHLIGLGHTRIAFVSRPEVYETDTDRRAGYRLALEEADLPYDDHYLIETDSQVKQNAEIAFETLMALDDPPTAILFFTDPMAVQALKLAKAKNIRIPEDISIVGYDGVPISAMTTPALTTVRQPIPRMGQLAVQRLLAHP